ncbi:hypothetical protein [Methanococcus voltae]|uniref:Uncharacterized protein n=2 Tax=Methanococcus voltae TaxID=2188 RepID=A0A8J7RG70_METVO|nr:hypothetical protein [Methanococcus voltae]MBP2171815.1 hypothetical protein [Methanococcus voltae]MBP2201247.1 hypothetical protein [Methanococcus voltae]MCS3922811.1 hypothetical protein [Methanococcus voltae PS]
MINIITMIIWLVMTYIIYVAFETLFTWLGTKLVKINVEFKQIAYVSAIKALTYVLFGLIPIVGSLLGILAAAYMNKEMFEVDWKNGFIIELPALVFILIAMLLAIIFNIVLM